MEAALVAPRVTVVIPARDEARAIGACLDAVLMQSEPDLQVIVVDGGSRDGTAAIVQRRAAEDPRVELIENPAGLIPRSLNLALAAARAPYLVRVDAHATVPRDYVARIVEHLETGEWSGVGGRKQGVGFTPSGRAVAAAMGSRFGVGNSTYHYGEARAVVDHVPFGAYPVDVARRLGGWDERCVVNQDYEFDYRVRRDGGLLLFDPELVIDWHCRQSVRELFQQYRRYGRGKANVAALQPRSVQARHLAAPTLIAGLAGAAVMFATRRPKAGLALAAPYAVALTAATATVAPRLDRGARRYVAPAFAAMHVGWGLGFWHGCAIVVRTRWTNRTSRRAS